MNARILSGCAVACAILGGTLAVLSADAPRALAQARAVPPPPPPGPAIPWSPDRPLGVRPDRWIPIGNAFGIVLLPQPPAAIQPRGPIRRSIAGYFAVRRSGRWWRLLITDGGSLTPLAASIASIASVGSIDAAPARSRIAADARLAR
ncbi:MAG: hypothetical protein ACREUT_07995 [Steroidobacteraceae bacterium]